ncbi:hypothetical protein LTR84_002581 [Exophiala bonariae]|uniref:Transcription factor TFIIIC triple barrel domain-containing protein n=1 Tax=Exophiala bonariae TaxID=1690606 RepID=A0AAV9N9R8_9EURO|nr:hypothetical protein LTR84_002581 [Exophiala bonariae]
MGKHESVFMRNGDDYCVTNDLCIGSAKIPDTMVFSRGQLSLDTPGPPVLTIVQIRRRKPFDACMHVETKDDLPPLPPPPRSRPRRIDPAVDVEAPHANTNTALNDEDDIDHLASAPTYTQGLEQNFEIHEETEFFERSLVTAELRVVARLWGWTPQSTTLTGLDTVSVSPNGQRIAISQWDRVLVYALDPVALCERPFDFDLDAADSNDGSSSAAGTDWGTTSDSGSESGDDGDANSNQGLGVQVGPLPPAASTNSDHAPPLNDHSAFSSGLSNNNISNDDADAGDNVHIVQSVQPTSNSENIVAPPTSTQGLPPPEPISPAVPEPPSSAFPQPAAPSSPKSSASTSRASSQSTTASARLLKFYPNTHDGFLGRRVVELRPIVLKMGHGAVVKKMIWSENSTSSDAEGVEEGEMETETGNEGRVKKEEASDEAAALEDSDRQLKETDAEADFVEAGQDGSSNTDPPPLPSSNDSAESEGSDTHSIGARNISQQYTSSTFIATNAKATTRKNIPATSSTTNATTIPEVGSSSGLTPESRLQISDSELKHQIRFVKRPPEYTMALNSEIIDLDIKVRRKTDGGGGDDHATFLADDGTHNDDSGDEKRKGTERDADTAQDDATSTSNPDSDLANKHDDDNDDNNDKAEPTNRPASPSHSTATAAAASSSSSTQHPASAASSTTERPRPRAKRRRRKKAMENELVVLTDRDVQVWDLGVWGTGKRVESELKFQRAESW